jgi:DNA-binding transcriptional ArsR family regulator
VRVLDTGGCTTRCLPPEAVQAGREQLGEGEARRVPFVCQISGDPSAAVLVGEEAAERILRDAGLGLLRGRTEAYALAGLAEATLCACDVATLLGRPQPEVEAVLRSLAEAGLTEERPLRGMPYFGLTPRGRRVLERALRTSSSGQAPPRREARDED